MSKVSNPDGRTRAERVSPNNPEGYLAQRRRYEQGLRKRALLAYGGCCRCCGNDYFPHLAFDHVDNDGARRRARNSYATASRLYALWRDEGRLDPGFQVLCHNCNMA